MFKIHPQLLNDCHLLGAMNSNSVLLHKNALLHWFILVPKTDCKNLLELNSNQLNLVMAASKAINQYLMNDLHYAKTNFASIGNIVDQLHIHIVGRKTNDACWPQPVWGNLPDGPAFTDQAIAQISQDLKLNKQ